MNTRRERRAHALADAIIAEALKADPGRVSGVTLMVVAKFKKEGLYGEGEIDRAVARVCKELGIPWDIES